MWKKIKSISGKKTQNQITALTKMDNSVTTTSKEIANTLADTFSKNSGDSNFDPDFFKYKERCEKDKIDLDRIQLTNITADLNEKIQLSELIITLKKCNNYSPGPDDTSNIFLKKLPEAALEYLLKLYNLIWTKNVFPKKWLEATVIPIPKPGKDKKKPNEL